MSRRTESEELLFSILAGSADERGRKVDANARLLCNHPQDGMIYEISGNILVTVKHTESYQKELLNNLFLNHKELTSTSSDSLTMFRPAYIYYITESDSNDGAMRKFKNHIESHTNDIYSEIFSILYPGLELDDDKAIKNRDIFSIEVSNAHIRNTISRTDLPMGLSIPTCKVIPI